MFGFFAWLNSGENTRINLLPDPSYKSSISQGEGEYKVFCIECHGRNLLGSEKGPSLLSNIYSPSHHADLAFYQAVRNGVKQHHWRFGDMPIITELSPRRVSDIIAYVRYKQKLSKN